LKDKVAILKSGNQFTVVVDMNGNLHSFGKNLNGELGINSQQSNTPRTRSISNPSALGVTQLSGAENATVALSGN
jgi:alpha-tubulin suppressor-like RCC1 family protein